MYLNKGFAFRHSKDREATHPQNGARVIHSFHTQKVHSTNSVNEVIMKHESRNKFNLIFVAAIMGWVLAGLPGGAFAQNINTPEHFPDPKFRAAVEKFMGVAPGGAFTAEQAAAKTGELNCASMGITQMKGIEFFRNLTGLQATFNQFTEIDLSNNLKLQDLQTGENRNLRFLDVTKNVELISINMWSHPYIKSIDLSHNIKLEFLYYHHTNISEIDLSKMLD